jgi:endonuclease/exonuclease/phosphatase family metal-dependent hydrolase
MREFGPITGSRRMKPLVKIASYNIHKCVGSDGVFDPARIVRVLAEIDADVVALQEADVRFGEREGLLNLQDLHDKAGLVPVPLVGSGKSHGWRGNVVLCREVAVDSAHQLILPGVEPRGAVVVDMVAKSLPLRVIATHFGLLRRSRERQVDAVLRAAQHPDGRCVVLMGDLNEWRVGRRSALSGLEPIFGAMDRFVPSYPAKFPVLALDRILCKPRHMLSHMEVHISRTSRVASDHLPVKADLIGHGRA